MAETQHPPFKGRQTPVMSAIDNTTGLPKREAFLSILENMRPWQNLPTGFALHLIDMHHFRSVNANYGRAAGDALLMETARRLREISNSADIVARFGSDEFIVIKFDEMTIRRGEQFATKIRNELSMPFTFNDNTIKVAVNVGTVARAEQSVTTEMLLRCAELALNTAKCEGPNGCYSYDTSPSACSIAEDASAQALRAAIKRGDFSLYYQPIVTATSRKTEGYEALLRWPTPDRGMIPPSEFIPIAERTGLINDLGTWALSEACREIANQSDTLCIAVNVSSVSLMDGNVASDISTALDVSGLDPQRLTMEITESVYLNLTSSIAWQIDKITEMGVRISIDDFGTGYSSLSNINAIPIHCIKIDQSFTRRVATDSRSMIVVQAILAMADGLAIRTIAEGIETEEEARIMIDLGATALQGYLFGRPLPATAAFGNDRAFQARLGLSRS